MNLAVTAGRYDRSGRGYRRSGREYGRIMVVDNRDHYNCNGYGCCRDCDETETQDMADYGSSAHAISVN